MEDNKNKEILEEIKEKEKEVEKLYVELSKGMNIEKLLNEVEFILEAEKKWANDNILRIFKLAKEDLIELKEKHDNKKLKNGEYTEVTRKISSMIKLYSSTYNHAGLDDLILYVIEQC